MIACSFKRHTKANDPPLIVFDSCLHVISITTIVLLHHTVTLSLHTSLLIVYCIASEPHGGEPSTIPDNRKLPMVCKIFSCIIPEQNRHSGGENSLLSSRRLLPCLLW